MTDGYSGSGIHALPKTGAPARTAAKLLALHGVGPKAIQILGEELARHGKGFREDGAQ